MNAPISAIRTTEVLNWLDAMANDFSIHFDKRQKHLAEDAILIIASKSLEPVEDIQKFPIPPELENMRGAVVGIDVGVNTE